jgi:AraC-like DNA-binding protein
VTTLLALDLMVRGGSIALFILWSWLLLRDHRHVLAARLAVAMNVTIICYVVSGLLLADGTFGLAEMIVDALSVMAPAFFWLFAHVWFSDSKRIGPVRWALVGAFMLLPLIQIIIIRTTGQFSLPCWIGVRIGMVGFAAAGLWIAWRGRDNDLVEPRRRFRTTIVWLIGGFVMWVNFIEMISARNDGGVLLRSATEVAILVSTFAVSAALYGFANPELFAAPQPTSKDADTADQPASPLADKLRAHMLHDRPYRAEGLTIAALAAQLGEQEYRLRRLINGELGFRNFTAFLNSYRLAEVREALSDPQQRAVPILTIALDAGFGSLGPFNRAFRDAEGMTPTAYRAAQAG